MRRSDPSLRTRTQLIRRTSSMRAKRRGLTDTRPPRASGDERTHGLPQRTRAQGMTLAALILVPLAFTAPADSAADRTVNVWQPCAAYRVHVEEPALTLFLPAYGDSLGRAQAAPR